MNIIMQFGTALFFILFAFLMFIFSVVLASFLKGEKQRDEFEPSISIVVPAYNEEKGIAECLDAINALNYPKGKREIIVIDDGSTDGTASIARKRGARVVEGTHAGKAAALNLGLKAARHGFIFTVDADTVVEKDCLRKIVLPLAEADVGMAMGTSMVKNKDSLLGSFQNVEYHYNNLIRSSFSNIFKNGIWFFGALACYRKSALLQVGGFKKDTLAEDWDIALELKEAGYRTLSVQSASGKTEAPTTFAGFYAQRFRWWMGTLQSLFKNKSLFTKKSPGSIHFLFINQYWWSVYAFLSLPLILYQLNYWLPYNSQDALSLFGYLFRWFSLTGPAYVLYKIPEWGVNYWTIFGVLSGVISAIMIVASIKLFKDRLNARNVIAVFFYFPYTILLNILIALSIIRYHLAPKRYFIR